MKKIIRNIIEILVFAIAYMVAIIGEAFLTNFVIYIGQVRGSAADWAFMVLLGIEAVLTAILILIAYINFKLKIKDWVRSL